MSLQGTTNATAEKRTPDQAELEPVHPRPKRQHISSFLDKYRHQDHILGIAASAAEDFLRHKPLQNLPSLTPQAGLDATEYTMKSPEVYKGSPSYCPPSPDFPDLLQVSPTSLSQTSVYQTDRSSPLRETPSTQVIASDEFKELQLQRMSQNIQDGIRARIDELKALHAGRLPWEFVSFLKNKLRETEFDVTTKDTAAAPLPETLNRTGTLISPVPTLSSESDYQITDSVLIQSGNDYKPVAIPTATHPELRPAETKTTKPDWVILYYKELEMIRMEKPFATGKIVITVILKLRIQPIPINSRQAHIVSRTARKTSKKTTYSINSNGPTVVGKISSSIPSSNVIVIDDDDEEPPTGFDSYRTGGAPCQGSDVLATRWAACLGNMSTSKAVDRPQQSTSINQNVSGVGDAHDAGHYSDHGYQSSDSSDHNDCYDYDHQNSDSSETNFEQQKAQKEGPRFYGLTGQESVANTTSLLRFQNRSSNVGQVPNPQAGHRLDLDRFAAEGNIKSIRNHEQAMQHMLGRVKGPLLAMDEEAAISIHWCPPDEPDSYSVMKGFPLVEEVQFIVQHNQAKPAGDCYWRSVSFCLYGSGDHWDLVKADHLAYVKYVLCTPGHARHQLYAEKLNKKFFRTSSADSKNKILDPFQANMWQTLHMAHSWTPALMLQVTADLYNVCLIVFTRETDREGNCVISETAVRGSYNSRHIFMQFVNGNHFMPMCPNEFRPSEFRYPRVTVDRTANFTSAPKATSAKSTIQHPWRNDFTKEVPAPVPNTWNYDRSKLYSWMGSKQ
ncbi:hypothetical protein E8E14_012572 [Neopestalotiopsis sp. 37M]|nr:hypothetical protein E8E14_012572 [Neopestalotiopsis sp. 37M]